MAKDRIYICEFYECKGKCAKGREANYNGLCQRCNLYIPKKNTLPARENNKRKKIEKARTKDS